MPVLHAWREPDDVARLDLSLRSAVLLHPSHADMMIRTCPAGCVCHVVRAPGSNVTSPPSEEVLAFAAYKGSTITDPVKFWGAPLADGREPLGEICVLSARAGAAPRNASATALIVRRFICVISSTLEDPLGCRCSLTAGENCRQCGGNLEMTE